MPSASIKKEIPCSKENLIKMVLDIEKYPEFVPWCLGGKIHNKIEKGDTIEIKADLTIGKSFFRDTYKSFVVYNKSKDTIQFWNCTASFLQNHIDCIIDNNHPCDIWIPVINYPYITREQSIQATCDFEKFWDFM